MDLIIIIVLGVITFLFFKYHPMVKKGYSPFNKNENTTKLNAMTIHDIPNRYIPGVETKENIYYVDPEEGDANGNVVCADKQSGMILSNNYFAACDLENNIERNKITKVYPDFQEGYKAMKEGIERDNANSLYS